VSPTFSSGKMRKMQPLIQDCLKNLENVLINLSKDKNNEFSLRQVMVNYTMDVVASCAFGTKIDTHNDPNNPFVKNASVFFRPTIRFGLFFLLNAWVPSLVKRMNLCFVSNDVIDFFKSAVIIVYFLRIIEIVLITIQLFV
jgi:cytochrome P450 family 3 subfamily A